MKKIINLAALALLVLPSCSKSRSGDISPLEANGDRIPLEFGGNVVTKGSGPVNEWKSQPVYVYGYERDNYKDKTPADFTRTAFVDGVKASAPARGKEGDVVLYDSSNGSNEPFFYGYKRSRTDPNKAEYSTYNFYAVCFDDAVSTNSRGINSASVHKNEDNIYLDYTINGTQDLMVAYANPADDIAEVGLTMPEEYAYSGYTARNNVKPNLRFAHKLSQFRFHFTNKSEVNMRLDTVYLDSYSKGKLYVAHKDVTQLGIEADEMSSSNFMLDYTDNRDKGLILPAKVGTRTTTVDAGALMVTPMVGNGKPSYIHTLDLRLSQEISPGAYKKMSPTPYSITPEMVAPVGGSQGDVHAFEPGKYYDVNIVVYSWERVEVILSLLDWEDGGSVEIDPDEPAFK